MCVLPFYSPISILVSMTLALYQSFEGEGILLGDPS